MIRSMGRDVLRGKVWYTWHLSYPFQKVRYRQVLIQGSPAKGRPISIHPKRHHRHR